METPTGTWSLDSAHSTLGFTVRHAGISKVRGRFASAEAEVNVGDKVTVNATVDAASFESGNSDRDAHIKSADFLDVEQFPTLSFRGELLGEELIGSITIHGVSKDVTFEVELSDPVKDPFGQTRVGAEATATINRKDFGLTWNAALEAGGVLVSNQVKIELDLAFVLVEG